MLMWVRWQSWQFTTILHSSMKEKDRKKLENNGKNYFYVIFAIRSPISKGVIHKQFHIQNFN